MKKKKEGDSEGTNKQGRREALKRMAKIAMGVTGIGLLSDKSIAGISPQNNDFKNYDSYSEYSEYSDYSKYSKYSEYSDYKKYVSYDNIVVYGDYDSYVYDDYGYAR